MHINDYKYDLFDSFLGTFIEGAHKSFVLAKANKNDTVSKESLEKLYDIFVKAKQKMDKGADSSEKFDDVVKSVKPEDFMVLNHAVWLWGFPNNRKPQWVLAGKGEGKEEKEDKKAELNKYRQMDSCSVAGAGSGYVQYKVKGIRFILFILLQIFDKTSVDEAKKKIEEICKPVINTSITETDADNIEDNLVYDSERKESMPDGVRNLLLHLCYPDRYEPIATTADKRKIVVTFNGSADRDLDEAIIDIRKNNEIVKGILKDGDSFYRYSLPLLWKGESNGDSLSRAQLLEYKQAMVLYGPPGTGKTYTAIELAKEILLRDTLRKQKKGVSTSLDIPTILKATDSTIQNGSDLSENIFYLQLHINYNYEDFIAGQIIDQSKGVITKKGFVFDIIEKANAHKEDKMPYVVILDEMNRVDVSRVFGELFTAIEKRNTDVFLTLPDPDNKNKRLVLNVPDNIYFIGTMNEIDFSLEQLDFALRRRFVWELVDYSEDALEAIIRHRIGNNSEDNNVSDFLNSSTMLNNKIADTLGKEYNIGHAFFAEIATLYNNLKGNKIRGNNWNQARKMLWQISILPTIEAYCGSMDRDEKKKFIDDCRRKYDGK